MMAFVSGFVFFCFFFFSTQTPTVAFVNACKKAPQLMYTADHYGVAVAEKSGENEIRKSKFCALYVNAGCCIKAEFAAESSPGACASGCAGGKFNF